MLFNPKKNIFGLDISDRALRLVQLKKKGKKIFLNSYNDLTLPPNIIVNGEIKNSDEFGKYLDQLVKTVRGKKLIGKDIITVLPETKTFIKVIRITRPSEENLPDLIKEEVKKHIPLSAEEIYLDWQILNHNNQTTEILIGAAPKAVVDSYLSTLTEHGFTPYAFEIEAAAVVRSLVLDNDHQSKIIIDFGATRSGLIVYEQEAIQFEVSLPIPGNKITETIAKILNLSWEEAEKAKIICGLDIQKCDGALRKILLKPIQDLADQIKETTSFYKTNSPGSNPISEVIICGGGANFTQIDQVLSQNLGLSVKIGDPLIKINQTRKISIPKDKVLSYCSAIGSALRAFQKKDFI